MKNAKRLCALALVLCGCDEAIPTTIAAPTAVSTAACGASWEGSSQTCPLQQWMRDHVGTTMTNGDFAGVAKALERTSTWSPNDQWEWSRIAREGAAAANESAELRLRAACRACHERYRPTYKSQYRMRPLASAR